MRIAVVCVFTLSLGGASAADVSPQIWKYVQGKMPGYETQPSMEGSVGRVWKNPVGLQAERLLFFYMPQISTEHWSVILYGPKLARTDYLGTQQVTYVGQTKSPTTNVYRVDGGMFKRFIVQELTEKGNRLLLVHSPAMALESPKLAPFVKK